MKNHDFERYKNGRFLMHQKVIPVFEEAGIESEVKRLKECGWSVNVISCQSCNTKHFAGFWRCKSRWCVCCGHIKILAWVARLVPILEDWLKRGNQITMVNFTIRDTEKLEDGILTLEKGWRRLTNYDRKHRERWKMRFPGGVRSLEVKVGRNSGKWHPHFHMLCLQESFKKDFEWLRDEWAWALGNEQEKEGSVWLKGIKANLLQSVVETLKYIIKPGDGLYKKNRLEEAYYQLKGKRQINTWGLLRGISKQVEEDVESAEQKKLTEFICQRCGCTEGELYSVLFVEANDLWLFNAK